MKFLLAILFIFAVAETGFSQTRIILRPGLSIGYGFNTTKDRTNVESSFHSPRPGFAAFLDGRIEAYLNNHNSVDLAIKGSEAAFSFSFKVPGAIYYLRQTSAEFTQYNLGLNHYCSNVPIMKRLSNEPVKLVPKIGFALGLSNNAKESYYKMYFTENYFEVTSSLGSFSRLYTITPENKIGFYFIARAGMSIFRNNKELFDLVLEYNKGVSNMASMDLLYKINGNPYRARLVSRGTNINITGSIPITVYRKK